MCQIPYKFYRQRQNAMEAVFTELDAATTPNIVVV